MLNNIIVMVSTYNGEKYIKTQIDSILSQDYKNINIIIRDDGSTDDTVKILKNYQKNHSNIDVYFGENIGVINSFFELIKLAPAGDYYAFCDQDDYWVSTKLSKAIKIIEDYNSDIPILYMCNKYVCNDNLDILYENDISYFKPSFGNAIIQNIITGTTAVFNKSLKNILRNPEYCLMHDHWLYLVATCFGEVIIDNNSYVYYRQHSNNVVGSNRGIKRIKKSIHRIKSGIYDDYHCQLSEFKRIYNNEIPTKELGILDCFLQSKFSFIGALKLLTNNRIYRQRKIDDVRFKLVYLLNTIKIKSTGIKGDIYK